MSKPIVLAVAFSLAAMPLAASAYFKYIPDMTPDVQQEPVAGRESAPATPIPLDMPVDAEATLQAQPMEASRAPDQ